MKKRMILMLSGALAFGLLSACGTPNESAHGGHGDHGAHDADGPDERNYRAFFLFAPDKAKASEAARLDIQVKDSNGKAVQQFEWSHEKLMHLIIVSKDLSFFNHIHPDWDGRETFTIDTTFPSGGEYKLFADVVPKGGSGVTFSEWVKVDGEMKPQQGVSADAERVEVTDGKEVTLALDSTKEKAETVLTFTVKDGQTKADINNLEPYLGAVGHVVILSEDAEQYVHVHPVDEQATGPDATFMTVFPNAGMYKIWFQFQHEGRVSTVSYVVEIQ